MPALGVLGAALVLPHACAWLILAAQRDMNGADTVQQQAALRAGNALVLAAAVYVIANQYASLLALFKC